jgi:hypothetical protein
VFLAGVLLEEERGHGKSLLRNVQNHPAYHAANSSSSSSGPVQPNEFYGQRLDDMYPLLLNLMMGIQVHLDVRAEELREEQFLRHTVVLAWRKVLGVLHTLLLVVQHAHQRGYVTLKVEPQDWERLIEEKRERVHAAMHALHALATQEVQVNTQLEPYRASLEKLHTDYDAYRQTLQLTAARKAQATSYLNWEMDVRHMLADHNTELAARIAAQLASSSSSGHN